MKKVLFFAVAIFIAGAFTSCKKDYTCECTFTAPTPNIDAEILKASKKDAEDACSKIESTYKIADPAANCKLK